jgi:hypothetical protein
MFIAKVSHRQYPLPYRAHMRGAEDLNAVLGNISTIPSIYREENE